MAKKVPQIDYTSRDFASIFQEIQQYSKKYYPNISKDENQASFDALMKESVSYIGDILSFYLDFQANESFFPTAIEYNNIIKHGQTLGYKFRGAPSSIGLVQFFAVFEANANGMGVNQDYLFTLEKGSQVSSTSGNGYILIEDVDFSDPSNKVVVHSVNTQNGIPTAYAVRASGRVISGKITEEFIDVGDFQKFRRIELAGKNISEILSIVDSEGNEYFETEYLAQDVIYSFIPNDNTDRFLTPFILRPVVVPRRFIVEHDVRTDQTSIQFGAGSENDLTIEPLFDPSTTVLNIFGKNYVSDTLFDPTNLLGSDKMGISPANTRLRIIYRVNTTDNVNASSNAIVDVTSPLVRFRNVSNLNIEKMRAVIDSIEVNNESSIIGNVSVPSIVELKNRIKGSFPAQSRAVSSEDYKALIYSMPAKLGAIKRVNVAQDHDSQKRNLNIYLVSENADASLVQSNLTLKQNVRQWLAYNKMMNDSIDLLDLLIVNIGIEFVAVADANVGDKFDVLNNAVVALRKRYAIHQNGGQNFDVGEVYKILQKVDGITDVLKVKIVSKTGAGYSTIPFDIDTALSADGRIISVPENIILEIKNIEADIVGVIR